MGEVDQMLELLEETKTSFIDHYNIHPISLEHLFPGRNVDSLNKDNNKIKDYCINYFDEILHKIGIIKDDKDSHESIFLYLDNKINELNSLVIRLDSEGKQSIPLFSVFDLLQNVDMKLDGELKKNRDRDVSEEQKQVFEDIENTRSKINEEYERLELMSDDYKHREAQKIYENDAVKFDKISKRYEKAFYVLILILILYFLGAKVYIPEVNIFSLKVSFTNKIHGDLLTEFYIQKISLLILSTTLLAFLLKRSFMYRRLADDAYRTSKELIALPRFIKELPQDMQDKVHFDLAYKYFGNGIHHESYTGGENLMHENIKANTDFIKAVKDLTPKVEVPKAEAVKDDKAPKDAA
ncbi:hypothetical protein [Acinetobacter sp. ANC 4178]|uniref:hypothetical protein n=1 Tax=Acinetobacter sp. ANC 4178 TaxID=2529839 RepID=UPI00103D7EA6|nr:hypothetical protein [Acinetobacter sp. ANC 4178]TCB68685.1 hypothetical protein E0H87_01725 [Acinetobacter sp. ANC 4178]